jgi:DNA-binding CsgD family transcriptional regulator
MRRFKAMNPIAEEILMHYGMPKRSGRYPWGSGEDPYQHSADFLSRIDELKKQGWKETPENIMSEFGLTTSQYRTEKALAKDERRMLDVATAKRLRDKEGLGPTEIGRKMGINESTVRSLLNEDSEVRTAQARKTADFIKQQIDTKGMIDVGTGVERELGISKEKLNEALYILEREGYPIYKGGIPQVTNQGKQINQRVICPPGTEHKEIYDHSKVNSLTEYVSHDGGDTFDKFVYPKSMDSKRMMVRYAEDGGIDKDGIVEIRRGVEDLSLGNSHYSQVRILVDNKKYIKGMAVYSDDMPDGVDLIFNTNKTKSVGKLDVLKDIKEDPDNPFGSLIKAGGQSYYIDKDGNRQLSLINKRADEGDWDDWKDALPSQFLGKQSKSMIKKQLDLSKADKLAELDEIRSLTNPTVKKHLLEEFASNCDAAAVHLQAAALPGQKYHVIIPVNTLKDTEVYAPNYNNGDKVALIRYPHGGTFEIPILTVNNKHAPAKKLIGSDSIDAVGINKKIADRLSGADFDGDTVMVIPTHDKAGKVKVTSTDPLKGLEGFDPKTSYGYDKKTVDSDGTEHYYRNGKEFRKMTNTGTQMGVVSNLITDMTLGGATKDELARAVRHSMVVIDAEKHKLDYKQSEIDNNISGLKKKYQITIKEDGTEKIGGASTILSRAKGETSVDKRQGTPKINIKGADHYDPSRPEGSLIYKTADDLYYDVTKVNKRTGEVTVTAKKRTQKSTNMAETDDAYTLVSSARNPKELLYADYANSMKSMANQARKEMVSTGKIRYSATAKETYLNEVNSLKKKLHDALLNSPRERAAQRQANAEVDAKKAANPNLKAEDVKKAGQQALSSARKSVGSISRRERNIDISDREWEAIQAGAVSENVLKQILVNTDTTKLRQLATPRATTTLSTAKINKIKSMSNSNYSLNEIAKACGVSTSTVSTYLKGVN